jgi:hypothetical protein
VRGADAGFGPLPYPPLCRTPPLPCLVPARRLPSDLPATAPPTSLCLPGSHRDHGAQMGAALYDPAKAQAIELPDFALRSGPRRTIYHNPKDVTAAIVTCERWLDAEPAWGWGEGGRVQGLLRGSLAPARWLPLRA